LATGREFQGTIVKRTYQKRRGLGGVVNELKELRANSSCTVKEELDGKKLTNTVMFWIYNAGRKR